MGEVGHYFLFALPSEGGSVDGFTFSTLQARSEGLADSFQTTIPRGLKFDSLDGLMSLSDELLRIDTSVATVVRRLCTAWLDVAPDVNFMEKWRETDLTQFTWNERVYPFAESAKALTNRIYKDVQQTETKVRGMFSRYQSLTRELAVENKKESGTLVTRRLDSVVPDNVIFESE